MRGSRDASQSPSSWRARAAPAVRARPPGRRVQSRVECRSCRSTSTTSRPRSSRRRPDLRPDLRLADRGGGGDRLVRAALDVEKDEDARAIMENAQGEEFKHFAMNLEFLVGASRSGRPCLRTSSSRGDIVEHGEEAEEVDAVDRPCRSTSTRAWSASRTSRSSSGTRAGGRVPECGAGNVLKQFSTSRSPASRRSRSSGGGGCCGGSAAAADRPAPDVDSPP